MSSPQDRLLVASAALKEYNPDHLEAIDDIDAAQLASISGDFGLKDEDYPRLIGIMIYIRKRLIEKMSRVASFKVAFPDRCIAVEEGDDKKSSNGFAVNVKPGEPISDSTIVVKSKRLESSKLYVHVYQLLQTNLYISYALDRMKVLDEALTISLDEFTPLRDKDRYMKLFLDETRKPENAKGLEVNFNLQNNSVNLVTVEDKMNTIAQALNHATAGEIIDMIHQPGSDDDNT